MNGLRYVASFGLVGKNMPKLFSYHDTTNRNGKYLTDFMEENNMTCLNTKFQKKDSKLWTFKYPNGIKGQLDYIIINNKWKNSGLNCEPYIIFEGVRSDHRIVTRVSELTKQKFQNQVNITGLLYSLIRI